VTGPPPGPPAAADDITSWHRLHPLSPLVRAGRHLVGITIVLLLLLFARQQQTGNDLIYDLVIIVLVLGAGVVSWLVTRWQVADGVLRIETGLVRRQSRRFPLSQVQAIDVVQTGLARVLGLAELRLRMAGADSSGGRLACLRLADAEQLRQRLLSMARATEAAGARAAPGGAAGASGAAGAVGQPERAVGGPERPLFRVRSERLAGAIALSRTGAFAGVVIAALVAVIVATGRPGITASLLPVVIGVVLAVWRQFNGEFGTVVSAAPEGLRLRSGLVQTTAETIRPGRVQAVRLVEPLVWRAFGWCRLEVDVAGPLLTAAPRPVRRPPPNARWKAPLAYHFLGWDGDDRYVVASRGRVCRKTTWVPLEKVQSIRWIQGPVQRRLGLASVRLDVAGRRVTASITDRDAAEAQQILARLPDLARAAREGSGAARGGRGSRAARGAVNRA